MYAAWACRNKDMCAVCYLIIFCGLHCLSWNFQQGLASEEKSRTKSKSNSGINSNDAYDDLEWGAVDASLQHFSICLGV